MDNLKEKLVELIAKAKEIYADDYTDHTEDEYIAEMLLDNGGTVQEWIPVSERLPERKCDCLTARKGDVYVESWDGVLFSERNHHGQPTHWMPLPEPPKGE